MKYRYLSAIAVLLAAGLGLYGCDNTTEPDVQLVKDVQWLPDGSGMLALMERTTYSSASASQYDYFDLYRIGTDGQLGDKIGLPSPVSAGYLPGVLVSDDGSTALLESGQNVARVDLGSRTSTIVLPSTYLLAASPDQHYVLTTGDAGTQIKLCAVYDITHLPARRVSQFNALNVQNFAGLWIDSGRFVLSHLDSNTVPYLTIYDTLGRTLDVIENSAAPFHASRFISATRDLFVLDRLNHAVRINLTTGERITLVPTASVNSMDASRDASLLVYCSTDTNVNRVLRTVNVATRAQADIGADAISVAINPQGNKLAYIHYTDPYNQEIRVQNVSAP